MKLEIYESHKQAQTADYRRPFQSHPHYEQKTSVKPSEPPYILPPCSSVFDHNTQDYSILIPIGDVSLSRTVQYR